jgi:hypothetical protein
MRSLVGTAIIIGLSQRAADPAQNRQLRKIAEGARDDDARPSATNGRQERTRGDAAQKVEEGAVNVTLRTVEVLAEAFGVDIADLLQR